MGKNLSGNAGQLNQHVHFVSGVEHIDQEKREDKYFIRRRSDDGVGSDQAAGKEHFEDRRSHDDVIKGKFILRGRRTLTEKINTDTDQNKETDCDNRQRPISAQTWDQMEASDEQ